MHSEGISLSPPPPPPPPGMLLLTVSKEVITLCYLERERERDRQTDRQRDDFLLSITHKYCSCIPDEKIQVNLNFWSGSEILF